MPLRCLGDVAGYAEETTGAKDPHGDAALRKLVPSLVFCLISRIRHFVGLEPYASSPSTLPAEHGMRDTDTRIAPASACKVGPG